MKLVEDSIVIESRYEIDDIISMVKQYRDYMKCNPQESFRVTQEELDKLVSKLDALYMMW